MVWIVTQLCIGGKLVGLVDMAALELGAQNTCFGHIIEFLFLDWLYEHRVTPAIVIHSHSVSLLFVCSMSVMECLVRTQFSIR